MALSPVLPRRFHQRRSAVGTIENSTRATPLRDQHADLPAIRRPPKPTRVVAGCAEPQDGGGTKGVFGISAPPQPLPPRKNRDAVLCCGHRREHQGLSETCP